MLSQLTNLLSKKREGLVQRIAELDALIARWNEDAQRLHEWVSHLTLILSPPPPPLPPTPTHPPTHDQVGHERAYTDAPESPKLTEEARSNLYRLALHEKDIKVSRMRAFFRSGV
jgi:hypothetical protein